MVTSFVCARTLTDVLTTEGSLAQTNCSEIMIGRDLLKFNTNCRPEFAGELALRLKNGLHSSNYKPAEFKSLQDILDAKRLESCQTGQKVQKICCSAKATKESSILRQHRQVWSRECPRLQKAENKAENDIVEFVEQLRPTDKTDTAIFSLHDYGLILEKEREAFSMATVLPIYQLKDDLCFKLAEGQRKQLTAHRSNWEQIMQQINYVKDQQDDINTKLHMECLALEEEITGLGLEKYFTSTPDSISNKEHIPEEVLDSDCPYPELKGSIIQAFHCLSEGYQSRIQTLQEQLQKTDRFCGWCAKDHQCFQFTFSQYTHDIPNYRVLCMDMLQRLFPKRRRQELMEHERLWDWQRFTQAHLRALTEQWQRDQEELLARALVTLQEATHAHQDKMELHRERQHQQDICSHLKEKLQQWQAQQEEMAKLEAVIAARKQEEEEARLRRVQAKEQVIRAQQKEEVRQFHLEQKKRMEVMEQRDQERLADLRRVVEEQARLDKERVQFRADMLQQRREERKARELERQREEEEKQNRLEVLRNQIGVVGEADPDRVMADTEAWRSRHWNIKEPELQRPLYRINTYTDAQIVSDPRVRVEQALREAGLHQSHYAKEVLSVLKPHKPPRRDTKSLLKF
ncbi:coiled-coil domain-containing protein 148-like [Antennarius striatus]|uniref:coiled-coil domain-containing protein 148-like n=1 Tax=Antennarius striatus TaxID=241820 RepID=UPI0035B4501E